MARVDQFLQLKGSNHSASSFFPLMTLNWEEAFRLCIVDDNCPHRLEGRKYKLWRRRPVVCVFFRPDATANLTERRQFDLAGVANRAPLPPPRIIIMSHAPSSIYTTTHISRRIYNEVAMR